MAESAILANLRLKENNNLVYPNTISDNIALPDGSKLTQHVDSVKRFMEEQSSKDTDIEDWKNETDSWKSTHTHTMSQITDLDLSSMKVDTAEKVSHDFKITFNGGSTENDDQYTFNGSRNVSLDITPDRVGAASWDHTHAAIDITGLDEMVESKIQTIAPSGHTHSVDDITGLNERLNSILNEDYYNSTVPATTSVGGISKGWTPTQGRIKAVDLLYEILHPYVAPSASASLSPQNGGTVEWNTEITPQSINVNFTLGSNPITKVEVYYGSEMVATSEVSSGVTRISVDVSSADSITKDSPYKNFSVRVYDDSGKYVTANTGSFTFVYPYYYGAMADIPTADDIPNLTKKIAGKGNQTITYNMSQERAVFVCYKGYGALSQILDANGFDSTGTFTRIEVTYDTNEYYIYYNSPSTNSNFKFTFKY